MQDPDPVFQAGGVNNLLMSDPDNSSFPWFLGYVDSYGDGSGDLAMIMIPNTSGPDISVEPTSSLFTTEGGGNDWFSVELDAEPTAGVTIVISSSNTTEGLLEDPDNPSGPLLDSYTLTFDATNWDQPQTVTVVGVDDAIEDGDVAYAIETAAATSSDPDYNGLDADDVSVTNLDDDSPVGGGTETYSSTDTPTNIPDQGMADSMIAVSDDYQIVGMTVTLNISHPRSSDLTACLVGPNSDIVELSNLSADNAVSNFNGISTDGNWTLEACDSRKKQTGTINGWSITVDD